MGTRSKQIASKPTTPNFQNKLGKTCIGLAAARSRVCPKRSSGSVRKSAVPQCCWDRLCLDRPGSRVEVLNDIRQKVDCKGGCGDKTTDLVDALVFELHVMFCNCFFRTQYERQMRCDTQCESKSTGGMGLWFVLVSRVLIAALIIRRCTSKRVDDAML